MQSIGSQDLSERDPPKQSKKTAPKSNAVPYASLAVPLDAFQLSTIPCGSWSDPRSETQKRCQSPTVGPGPQLNTLYPGYANTLIFYRLVYFRRSCGASCQSLACEYRSDGMKRKREEVENHQDDHKMWRAY